MPEMPFCTYCGQSFTRDEHLERHILTHTNVKPYKCLTCHMSFARRDLLQRHYVVHGKDANDEPLSPQGLLAKAGARTPIACHNCAKTKIKCDKKFPCTRCATRNLTCTVRPTRRATKNGHIAQQIDEGQISTLAREDSSSGSSREDSSSDSPVQPRTLSPRKDSTTTTQDSPDPWTEFMHLTNYQCQTPHMPTATPQMPELTFEDFGPMSSQAGWPQPDNGPDGLALPLPSPLLPNNHIMFDWSQVAHQFDPRRQFASSSISQHASTTSLSSAGYCNSMSDGYATAMTNDDYPIDMKAPSFSGPRHNSLPSAMQQLSPVDDTDRVTFTEPLHHISDPAVIEALATAHDAWSVFRCNPCVPSRECPKTARLNLETLEQSLADQQTWTNYNTQWQDEAIQDSNTFDVAPLHETARDKLLAITQSFLVKALDAHERELAPPERRTTTSNFVLLPPTRVLELFLRTPVKSFEQYYPLTSRSLLDINKLIDQNSQRAACLLTLLTIAQGASVTPGEGQIVTAGLIEACRISLFDVVEKNIMMASDHVVLHSALLFTVQASWSGDKWQMDIAAGQRGMYINMLRHSGRLEPKSPRPNTPNVVDTDLLWEEWIEQESSSRLIYAWAMFDQETSLFHDSATIFSVTEFGEPLPSANPLWQARSPQEWTKAFEESYEAPSCLATIGHTNRPFSLRTCLQKHLSAATTKVQLKEASAYLQRWHSLAETYVRTKGMCSMMQASLILFHLISLNTVTSFTEIEQLARRDESELCDQHIPSLHKRCVSSTEEALVHCGQILRLTRSMSATIRPPWWAGAIYRVALVLWTISLEFGDSHRMSADAQVVNETYFPIDTHPLQHPAVARYMTDKQGTPVLTRQNGSQMLIDNPLNILLHCTQVIAEGVPTRFTDGLTLKLSRLARDGSR